jgi:hypothetical protein
MRENMGVEAQAADVVKDGIALLRKIPAIVTKADDLLTDLETREKTLRQEMDDENAATEQRLRTGYLAGGVFLGALAAYLLMLAV